MKIALLIFVLIIAIGCKDKKSVLSLKAYFSYVAIDTNPNYLLFTNESTGSYSLTEWNFGQEETFEGINQKLVYYPFAGTYTVSLTVWEKGRSDQHTEEVTIAGNDISVSFRATVTDTNDNYIAINNLSSGTFDSLRWDFGTGKTSTTQNPGVLLFPYRGMFTIRLTAYSKQKAYEYEQKVNISHDIPNLTDQMELVWSDDFDGSDVNEANWSFMNWNPGHVNNEWQRYVKNNQNYNVRNGQLSIIARRTGDNTFGGYTSTRLESAGKREFRYGRIEIRAKVPGARGTWSALWCLGSNIGKVGWPRCGEIDIMEHVGYNPNHVHATVHTTSGSGVNGPGSGAVQLLTVEEEFHNYGIIWTPSSIKFYHDSPSNVIYTYNPSNKNEDTWPFDQPVYIILNLAVGGTWGGQQGVDENAFPQTLMVEHVRVYQLKF